MKRFKTILFFSFLLLSMRCLSQVGIGTTAPTKELDVNGDLRVRNLSNTTGSTKIVSAMPDGTLVIDDTNYSTVGTKFVGLLTADIALNTTNAFKEIILGNELIDVNNEYDTTTGKYLPSIDGYYKVSMDFDIADYSGDIDIYVLIGLWDFTLNQWVMRRIFNHRDSNNNEIANGIYQSYSISNYLQLLQGHSYGFRIYTSYNSTVTKNAKLKYLNSGGTGNSLSTCFSIEKVL